MNIETVTEFCFYCKKRLHQNEQYYHKKCHEESKEYKKQFDHLLEIDDRFYWKKDWGIEQKLREWAEKHTNIRIYIDYNYFKDKKSDLDVAYIHDLRIINKSTENIPDILNLKGIEYIYLFFKANTNLNGISYSIPRSILTLKTLKGLWIDNIRERAVTSKPGNIKNIQNSMEELINLERLFLHYEGADFPKGLKNLKKLKELTIGSKYTSNKIKLAPEVFELPNLKRMSCGFIEPTERLKIVKKLKKMKSFEHISFRDNDYNLTKRIASVDFKLKTTYWKDANILM